ncbi:MAG: hypothetical protein NT062_00030, partial [Proteobacteria bacterium]|nr:hypothetical protein [Pseudomonadota bacterium]
TSDTLSMPITLGNTCQTPTSPVVIYAYDINYVLLANAFLPTAATTDGATPTIAAWDAYPAGNIAFTLTGAGPEITYSELHAQQQYGAFSENTYSYATATTGTLPTNGLRQYHSLYLDRAGQYGHHYSQSTAAATATSVTFAVPATLPWVGQMAVSSLGATWLQTAGTYDGTVGSFNWSVFDSANETTHYFKWNVIVPAGPTSFSWSQFPASLASRLPPADAFVSGYVELIDLAGDYDAMRALPEWQLTCVDCAVSAGELPHADSAFPYGNGGGVVASPRHTAMVAKIPSAHPQPRSRH